MYGQIHAFSLLGVVVGTLAIILMNHRRPSWKQALVGLVIGTLFCFAAIALSFHNCDNGQPLTQWLLPGICFFAIATFVQRPWLRRIACSFCVLLMMALSIHYSKLVHGPDFIGNAALTAEALQRQGIHNVQSVWHSWLTGLYSHQ